jgi:hypothetical protein
MKLPMADEICPALTDLSEPSAPHVRRHVANCLRCKVLVRHLGISYEADPTAEDNAGGAVERPARWEVSPGDICAAKAIGLHHRLLCVIAAEDAGIIEVVPISDETEYACDRDLLIDPAVLGYKTMTEAWNMGSLLVEDIDEVIVRLDDEVFDQLVDLIEAVEDGEESDGLPTGAPIVFDEDARHAFQQRESQRALPFFASSSLVRSVSTVPDLILRASEETDTSIALLSRRCGPLVEHHDNWVEDVVARRTDVRKIPGRTVGALFAEFDLRPSKRLAAIVRCTGWPQVSNALRAPTALIAGDHDDTHDTDADEYISEVFDGLMKALGPRAGT